MTHTPSRQRALVAVLAAATALSYVGAPRAGDLTLHHIGTAAGIAGLVWTMRRAPLSDAASACVTAFLLIHVTAAHWLYSSVPYDRWTEALFGVNVTEAFGFRRNHFDRVVHFAFGALAVLPVREVLMGRARLARGWARVLSVDIVLSTSAVYELIEWGVAVVADPVHAERYNGQQGDFFDAQKDMGVAALGAVLATLADAAYARHRTR